MPRSIAPSVMVAALASLSYGCSDPLVITCDPARHGAECLQGGISGECVATCDDSAHYCAFSAPRDCPETGLAYGALSASYSETCVETCALEADAGPPDGGESADGGLACQPKIAFTSGRDAPGGDSNVILMNLDGSNQKRVNTTDGFYLTPRWSPDGRSLLVGCNFAICTIPARGGAAATVFAIDSGFAGSPQWTPDSTKIVYEVAESSPSTAHDIWIMNADGSARRRLTSTGTDGLPRVSPDGTKISFVSTRDGNAEIYVMDIDGSAQTNVSHRPGNDSVDNRTAGLWSPDGTQLLYVSDGDPNVDTDIFAVPSGGGASKVLANLEGPDSSPAWSPDGTKIAWVHGQGIRVMNADGSGQLAVTDGVMEDSTPVWIDATHIAFVRYSGQNLGAKDIFSAEVKPDAPVVRLTNDPSGDLDPSFTPCARP